MKEVTRLEDLSLGRDDWTIFVRVVRKWESKTRTGDNPKISDDFLLVDDQVHHLDIKVYCFVAQNILILITIYCFFIYFFTCTG